MTNKSIYFICGITILVLSILSFRQKEEKVKIYLIGDSTMADYANYGDDYIKTRYPVTGWGQVFQGFFDQAGQTILPGSTVATTVEIDDRARGGRSTRTFFEEGRWRSVYENIQEGDWVMMQFGHNDAATEKTERYVTIEGYKEFLRLFISQTREKGGNPVVLTPVNRNYPWKDGQLQNCHGEYYQAALEVAKETETYLIDLTMLSIEEFTGKGQEYVTSNYFMNFGPGLYEAYPEGSKDNTHFQPEGAKAVAALVFEAFRKIDKK
ncbi:rhamnogalacturonan acetylesterase [Belliella marina]|uniref:Rhamnogalacturonan acetylesterase n=1 Tax=Belliella marina TaxID=1644146 RepID=A0ABW4VJM6_9BACT